MPTQNPKKNSISSGSSPNVQRQAPKWQEPEPQSTQKFITPEAEKSLKEGAGRHRVVRLATNDTPKKKRSVQNDGGQQRAQESSPVTLKEAVKGEIQDRLRTLRLGISINAEDLIRAAICLGHIIILVLLQTTLFHKFAPFGAVPDLMISLVAAIAIWEGEKWGAVCGLVSAFFIQSMGDIVSRPNFLPLLYCSVGYAIGIIAGYYANNSIPVKTLFIVGAGTGRAAVTLVTGYLTTGASIGQVLADMVIPEFFATIFIAPAIYFIFWLTVRKFHRTRQEMTDMSDMF